MKEFFIQFQPFLIFIFLSVFFISCTKKDNLILDENNPIITGEKILHDSSSLKLTDTYYIKIDLKALELPFLMNSSYTGGSDLSPGPFAYESKIVMFKQENDFISLIEIKDHLHFAEYPSRILAQFPIIQKDAKSIIFDFDKGMKHIYQRRSTPSYNSSLNQEHKLDITQSFLYMAHVVDRYLIIKHQVEFKTKDPSGKFRLSQATMKYTFSTYQTDPSFYSSIHPDDKYYAFFETHPWKNTSHITKLNVGKKTIFHYTHNFPKEYISCLFSAINYWNQLIGKDLLEILPLPEEIGPYDPNFHIIEWMEQKKEFGYTSLQVDPLTGEILQSYIQFPNPFLNEKFKFIKEYLGKFPQPAPATSSSEFITITHFSNPTIPPDTQEVSTFPEQSDFLKSLEIHHNDPQTIKRIVSDIITALLTHEIGHILGLKHNFAGSLSSNLSNQEKEQIYYQYLDNDFISQNLITSSTLMDYLPASFLALSGAKIRKAQYHFSWDKLSIDYAYNNIQTMINEHLFCSDEDLENATFIDCQAFDYFSNPLVGSINQLEDGLKIFSFQLASNLSDGNLSKTINPEKVANELFSYFKNVANILLSQNRFLKGQDSMAYQYLSLKKTGQELQSILLNPFIINSNKIPVLYNFEVMVETHLNILKKSGDNYDVNFNLIRFWHDTEEAFLKKYLSYLNKASFNPLFFNESNEIEFYQALYQLITHHLSLASSEPIDVDNLHFYPRFFNQSFLGSDLRHQFITLATLPRMINWENHSFMLSGIRDQLTKDIENDLKLLLSKNFKVIDQEKFNRYIQSEQLLLDKLKK